MKCPACLCDNPTDEHLKREYLEMLKASFDKMFGHIAKKTRREIARELHKRNIYQIENPFGPIPVKED